VIFNLSSDFIQQNYILLTLIKLKQPVARIKTSHRSNEKINYRTLCQRALWDLSKGKNKLPHSVPKGNGNPQITALCAKGQGKKTNYSTLCQRALWDLSKGKNKLPHSVPKGNGKPQITALCAKGQG
jgi:hypothetical protein